MRTSKHGFTLIELLVVLSVGGLLMGLAIQVVERSMMIGNSTIQQLDEARNLNRLADQFRRDLHLAVETKLESTEQIIIRLQSGSVTYDFGDGGIQRTELASGEATRNERYMIGETRSVSFIAKTSPDRLQLTVQSRTGLKHLPLRTERVVVAETGRRNRLTSLLGESQ